MKEKEELTWISSWELLGQMTEHLIQSWNISMELDAFWKVWQQTTEQMSSISHLITQQERIWHERETKVLERETDFFQTVESFLQENDNQECAVIINNLSIKDKLDGSLLQRTFEEFISESVSKSTKLDFQKGDTMVPQSAQNVLPRGKNYEFLSTNYFLKMMLDKTQKISLTKPKKSGEEKKIDHPIYQKHQHDGEQQSIDEIMSQISEKLLEERNRSRRGI